jgi:hypothetical protein
MHRSITELLCLKQQTQRFSRLRDSIVFFGGIKMMHLDNKSVLHVSTCIISSLSYFIMKIKYDRGKVDEMIKIMNSNPFYELFVNPEVTLALAYYYILFFNTSMNQNYDVA